MDYGYNSSILSAAVYTACEDFNILESILQCNSFFKEADQWEYLEKHIKHRKCNKNQDNTYLYQQYSKLVRFCSHFQAA